MTTSGTMSSYTVDIWSGNHPFFQGSNAAVLMDEGRVNRFNRRFTGLEAGMGKVGTGTGGKLAYVGKDKKKDKKKGGGRKK